MNTSSRGFISLGIVLLTVIGLAVLGGAAWYRSSHISTVPNQALTGEASTTSVSVSEVSDYSAFARVWWHHGMNVTISKDGSGTVAWRTGGNPQPSEDGQAAFRLTRVDGLQATGDVLTSNDTFVPVGPVYIKLLPYDMAAWQTGTEVTYVCSFPSGIDSTNSQQTTAYYKSLSSEATEAQKQCGA